MRDTLGQILSLSSSSKVNIHFCVVKKTKSLENIPARAHDFCFDHVNHFDKSIWESPKKNEDRKNFFFHFLNSGIWRLTDTWCQLGEANCSHYFFFQACYSTHAMPRRIWAGQLLKIQR